MSEKQSWEAFAPSNLALIKYAGKKDKSNLPLNSSLSYTLDHLVTKVCITPIEEEKDKWAPLKDKECFPIKLSDFSIKRFLDFFRFLKKTYQVSGSYLVQSANNFPAEIGAASSASSFCALTRATHQLALSRSENLDFVESLTPSCLSVISRQGSGSSCRSFFSPWALWEGKGARPVTLPFSQLKHQLVLVGSESKKVSSSKAHEQIINTPALEGRVERAHKRLAELLSALNEQNWKNCFEIVWEEFQDLHQLYESAGIYYRNEKSYNILTIVKEFWNKEKDGPLVTMDAGSSVHLLYRPDQNKIFNHFSSVFSL